MTGPTESGDERYGEAPPLYGDGGRAEYPTYQSYEPSAAAELPSYDKPADSAPPPQYPPNQYPGPEYANPGYPGTQQPGPQYPNHYPGANYPGTQPYPGGGYPVYGTPYPVYPQNAGTNGLATGSLIASCIGVVSCGLGSIVGVVLGIVALRQIRETGQPGRGLAIAGVAIGALMIVLIVGYFIAAVMFAAASGTS